MLIGQYSVGKTTFIRYLLGRDFPGQRIGPEPTTDRFTAVMDGTEDRIIPGNALAVSADQPFRGLERFGVAFLNRFEGAQLSSQVLRNITLIDTPGVLSGEKQRVARYVTISMSCGFNFVKNALQCGVKCFCTSYLLRYVYVVHVCMSLSVSEQNRRTKYFASQLPPVCRGYDFNVVCGWFAGRADLILLLFDAHKLDISDEFKSVIESLKGNDDKIR